MAFPLPGGTVKDAPSAQNFQAIASAISGLQGRLSGFLAIPGNRTLAEGEGELEWAGSTQESKTTEVAHGLSSTPTRILITPKGGGAARLSTPEVVSRTSSHFKAQAWTPYGSPAGGSKLKFDWIAIA